MSPENFCYWLKGYFEIAEAGDNDGKARPIEELSRHEVRMIKQHLDYVFRPKIFIDETKKAMKEAEDKATFAIC